MSFSLNEHQYFMGQAQKMALLAFEKDEVPIGAVLVSPTGEIISKTHNLREEQANPCAHAEILALSEGGHYFKDWRFNGATLYITLEPCPMCLGAAIHARLDQVVFGAYDFKGGALSLGFNLHQNPYLNHRLKITGGIAEDSCGKLLSQFFREKRDEKKKMAQAARFERATF